MLRGTKVADAYVRITADGSSINDEIADSFEDVDYSGIDKKAGKALRRSLDDYEVDADAMLAKVGGAFENDERIQNAIAKQLATAFDEGRLEDLFERIGKKAGIKAGDGMESALRRTILSQLEPMMVDEFMRGGGEFSRMISSRDFGAGSLDFTGPEMDRIIKAVETQRKAIEKEREEAAKQAEIERALAEAHQRRLASLKRYTTVVERSLKKIRLDPDFSPAQLRDLQSRLRTLFMERADFHANLRVETDPAAIAELQAQMDKRTLKIKALLDDNDFQKKLDEMHVTALRMDKQRTERMARQAEQQAARSARLAQQQAKTVARAEQFALRDRFNFAGKIGGLFGKGSRNNFLNLIGSSVGGLASVLETGANAAVRFGVGFTNGMAQAGRGASMMARLSSGLARGLGAVGVSTTALVVALPAAAIAIVGMVAAVSALVSVVGALAGLLTAVASTIASGLTGAAIVGGAAFAGLAATIGLVTLGFKNMSIQTRKTIKEDLGPVKTMLSGLGEIVSRNMFSNTGDWAVLLKQALVGLVPLAQSVGIAMRNAIGSFAASLSGPGVQMFVAMLSTQVIPMMGNLAVVAGRALNGLLAVFAGVMPYVTAFTSVLANLAARFSLWATSVRGQNAIADFVARAVTSLQSLWNAVRAVAGFIAAVLFAPSAQKAGGTIFDGIINTFDRLKEKVKDGSLKKWFDDSITFGKKLWIALVGLGDAIISLYDSGILQTVGDIFAKFGLVMKDLAPFIDEVVYEIGDRLDRAIDKVTGTIKLALTPMASYIDGLSWIGEKLGIIDKRTNFGSRIFGSAMDDLKRGFGSPGPIFGRENPRGGGKGLADWFKDPPTPDKRGSDWLTSLRTRLGNTAGLIDELMNSGKAAQAGKKWAEAQKKAAKQYKNPYKWWALSLIKDENSLTSQIGKAAREGNEAITKALREASRSVDVKAVRSSMQSTFESLRSSAEQLSSSAQQKLNAAAQDLASASNPAEATRALRKVKAAQAEFTRAIQASRRLTAAGETVRRQQFAQARNVNALLRGVRVQNATLADYALARARMAKRLENANKRLENATKLRSDYRKQVSDAIKAYGALTTAEAKTIDGVSQKLTSNDIVANLRDRLAKIRAFTENLRILSARGLSKAAYKQIVDAGVENGSDYARALVAGGTAAVQQVNGLTQQISNAANSLGTQASNRLYQAGVQVAAGLVAGLKSQSAQLDAAAISLGNRIAKAIRRSLGIKSPARVPMNDMEYVGDGVAIGLDRQASKVSAASERLSSLISFTPAQAQAQANVRAMAAMAPVSGNAVTNDITVITPTKDPVAVAKETLNEMTGRFL